MQMSKNNSENNLFNDKDYKIKYLNLKCTIFKIPDKPLIR